MFSIQIVNFAESLNNLRDFVSTVSTFLEDKDREELKDNKRDYRPLLLLMHKYNPEKSPLNEKKARKLEKSLFEEMKLEVVWEEGEDPETASLRIKMDGNLAKNWGQEFKNYYSIRSRKPTLYCNSLISLVSTVEWFLAQLVHTYYKEYPESISSKEKQFSLEELGAFETIDDARNFLIDKSVESVLRGGLLDWISFLKTKLKLSMGYLVDHKATLVEITQRRNLLVHNGGVVNRIYLSNISLGPETKFKIGDKVEVSFDYLDSAISIFERCFLLIAAELWKKLERDNQMRGKILNDIAYKHLLTERYDVAESLGDFTAKDKHLEEKVQLTGRVNYWLSKKFGGGFDNIRKEIVETDFSAKSRLFVLAKNALLDNFDEVHKDIEYLLEHKDDKNGEGFSLKDVETWPLFKIFREQPQYVGILNKFRRTNSDNSGERIPNDEISNETQDHPKRIEQGFAF